jgi:hypothetical protein
VFLRGKVTERSASLNHAPGFGAPSRRTVSRASVAAWGKPRPTAKPDCSSVVFALSRSSAEATVQLGTQSHDNVHANNVARSFA